jgi:hypothetical protein
MTRARLGQLAFWIIMLWGVSALPASAQSVKEMLGVPGPISFQDTEFALAWSSRPSPGYIKQEYVPAGEQPERFNQMFMIEADTNATPQAAAAAQVDMLKKRKGTDPVVNYDLIRNDATGEIILDFLMSDSGTGEVIVEWNAYRYAPLSKDGGVALYAISRRGYGDGAKPFLQGLKQNRHPAINALAAFDAPKLTPAP